MSSSFLHTIFLTLLLGILSHPVSAQVGNDADSIAPPVSVDTLSAEEQEDGDYSVEDVKSTADVAVPDTAAFRIVADTTAARLRKDQAFAYANDSAYWQKDLPETRNEGKGFWYYFDAFFHSGGVRFVFYTLLIALLLFVVYRIIESNNLYMFRKPRPTDSAEAGGDEVLTDEPALEKKIRQAIEAGNYRVAVRYLYLKSLRSLDKKGWIRYHAQATNNDYIHQVSDKGIGREFRFLTNIYEYVWYGEFELSGTQFGLVQQQFQQFHNTIRA